jgi:hypothetical protein
MKVLVVLYHPKRLIGSENTFEAVYGEFENLDGGVSIGEELTVYIPETDISYLVRGLEGHWLEPQASNSEILVL